MDVRGFARALEPVERRSRNNLKRREEKWKEDKIRWHLIIILARDEYWIAATN